MFETYTMQLMSWWLLFGVAVLGGVAFADNDNDGGATPAPAPEPELAPFAGFDDFDPNAFGDIFVGTEADNTLNAPHNVPSAIAGLGGNDLLDASYEADYILGGEGNDTIFGRPGADIIRGGDGNDLIQAGWQNDTVTGDAGNDTIDGLYGHDVLLGADGDDLITGFEGNDRLIGDAGNDTLSGYDLIRSDSSGNAGSDGADILDGGEGNDQLWLGGGDRGTGGAGADAFISDARSETDTGVAIITDYNSDEDQLFVIVPKPAEGATMPEITQSVSENGEDRLILLDGVEIARVVGAGQGNDLDVKTVTEAPQS